MGVTRVIKRNHMCKKIKEAIKKEKVSTGELRRGLGKMSLQERYNTLCGKEKEA